MQRASTNSPGPFTRGRSTGSFLQFPNLCVQHHDNKQSNLSTKPQRSDSTVSKPNAVSNMQSLVSILNTVCSPCRSECSNCEVGQHCGVIMHGNAATFCEPYGPRELVSEGCLVCWGWGCRLCSVSAAEMLVCFERSVFSREAPEQGDKPVECTQERPSVLNGR